MNPYTLVAAELLRPSQTIRIGGDHYRITGIYAEQQTVYLALKPERYGKLTEKVYRRTTKVSVRAKEGAV